MSRHTPGPWVIARMSHSQIYVTQPQDRPDRTPGYYAEVRRFTPNHDEVEANARLIAAAPDLLEALEDVVKQVLGAEADMWLDIKQARVAIARVKGGKP